MTEAAELLSQKRCPVCGKEFTVLWPHQWAYKRGISKTIYFCSWKCLRADEKKGEKKMGAPRIVSEEQEKEAVRIALEGGDPLKYLEECGSNIPPQKWYQIKQKIKDTDPETYAKLPKRIPRKDAVKKPVETPEGEYAAGKAALELQTQSYDIEAIMKEQEILSKLTTTAVKHADLGEFYYDRKFTSIDWRTAEGDEISMAPALWKQMIEELPVIMRQLGVEA